MRQLIIHADDFGLSEGVTRGIIESMTLGVVSATSAMVCNPDQRRLVARSAHQVQDRLGLHLQLTDGKPVSNPRVVPSLVDSSGHFPRHRAAVGALNMNEVLLEWRAQVATLRGLGVTPSHLDAHHHVHTLAGAGEAYVLLAAECELPARPAAVRIGLSEADLNRKLDAARVAHVDQFICLWTKPGQDVSANALLRALRVISRISPETATLELGCHPGFLDADLMHRSTYVTPRRLELAVVCQADLRDRIAALGWEISGFQAVARRKQSRLD